MILGKTNQNINKKYKNFIKAIAGKNKLLMLSERKKFEIV